jgi:hypothetical protein
MGRSTSCGKAKAELFFLFSAGDPTGCYRGLKDLQMYTFRELARHCDLGL